MKFYTDDPGADAAAYDAYVERELGRLPRCDCCGKPITDDYCYDFGDEIICERCLDDTYKKKVDNYIEY